MFHFGDTHVIEDGFVYWQTLPIPHADPTTFRSLAGEWACDARSVYFQATAKKIDVTTCEVLNPVFAKDAHAAYDGIGRISGADAKTFETLDPGVLAADEIATRIWACGYARDRNAVFFQDQACGKTKALRDADPSEFKSLRNHFGFDSQGVWCFSVRIPGADPRTWVYLGRWWSMDSNRMYYGTREIPGVNRESFTIVGAPTTEYLATDGTRFFKNGVPIAANEFWTKIAENFVAFEGRFRLTSQGMGSRRLETGPA